jgi:hypothetical protein
MLPNELPGTFQPLHLILIVSMGPLVGEIWDLDGLQPSPQGGGICRESSEITPTPLG